MADTKVTGLTEDTAPVYDDLVMTVDDPGGTPVSKKAELQNLFGAISGYGGISVTGNASGQSGVSTPEKITQFNTNMSSSAAITADQANNKLTLNRAGKYLVLFQLSFSGTSSSTWLMQAYHNGSSQSTVACQRKLGTGGDVGSCSGAGIISVATGGQDLDVRADPDGTDDFTVTDGCLVAIFLGA